MKATIDTDDYIEEVRKQFAQGLADRDIEATPRVEKIIDQVTENLESDLEGKEPASFAQKILERAVEDRMNGIWNTWGFFFDTVSQSDKQVRGE